MHYVYILESMARPGNYYIGYTTSLRQRVRKHQAEEVSSHAAKYRPWKLKASSRATARQAPLFIKQLNELLSQGRKRRAVVRGIGTKADW